MYFGNIEKKNALNNFEEGVLKDYKFNYLFN